MTYDPDRTTDALDTTATEPTAALVRGLLATLPRALRYQLAREVLGLPPPGPDEPRQVDTGERAVVASVFDGLPPK